MGGVGGGGENGLLKGASKQMGKKKNKNKYKKNMKNNKNKNKIKSYNTLFQRRKTKKILEILIDSTDILLEDR